MPLTDNKRITEPTLQKLTEVPAILATSTAAVRVDRNAAVGRSHLFTMVPARFAHKHKLLCHGRISHRRAHSHHKLAKPPLCTQLEAALLQWVTGKVSNRAVIFNCRGQVSVMRKRPPAATATKFSITFQFLLFH